MRSSGTATSDMKAPGGTTPTVRTARLKDAFALGSLHVRAWRHAYRGLMPDSLLDSLDEQQRIEQWRQLLDD